MQVAEAPSALTDIFDGLTGLPRVAVAVSGGSDSMALLRLVAEWSRTGNGPHVVAALTVDHGLRPESADEAQQVATWCAGLGISHHILKWQGTKPTSGMQAKARVARYDLLAKWCRDNDVMALLTGHTANDQAETVYMRQQRTSSAKSLAGIWPENEWLGVRVFRPLLNAQRDDLRAYLTSMQQGWLEDPSNFNTQFERVRVRQLLAQTDVAGLQDLAAQSQSDVLNTNARAKAWLWQFMVVDRYAVVRLARRPLLLENQSVRQAVLLQSIEMAGEGGSPERASVAAIEEWVMLGGERRRSLNGAIVGARLNVIEIMREPDRIRDRWVSVPESGGLVFDNRFHVTAPAGSLVGPMGRPPLLKRAKDVPALAFSALPAVKLADGQVVSAVKSNLREVSATLCERFSL